MSGRRALPGGQGRRPLEELVRLACSTDPEEPVTRPRRLALAPRVAVVAGTVLIVLALVLALRAVRVTPAARQDVPAGEDGVAAASQEAAGSAGSLDPQPASPVPASGTGQPGVSQSSGQVSGQVTVHVAGAVHTPGVVVLSQGARVVDAINAAGGATPDADTDQLNLARVLADGEQVRVPRVGEVLPEQAGTGQETAGAGGPAGSGGQEGTSGSGGSGLVNINTASATELESLPGIGPALAERIVEYRQANGPFASVDDLTEVSGIGQAKLEALRDMATV